MSQSTDTSMPDAQPTPFERAIDEVANFNVLDVLKPMPTYREPLDVVCGCCGQKHCFKPECRA